ncbi:MAG: Fic family protein [Mycoplasmataceae bacterium]|jgi:Fic family protein|nr:Fic family protein [Mycoplasmataceae bacterium]
MKTLLSKIIKDGKIDKNNELYISLKNDFTFHSSAIEGSHVTLEENMALITNPESRVGLLKKYPEKEVYENENLIKVFDYVIDTYTKPLTDEYIKNLHKMLCFNSPDLKDRQELAGEFRKKDVYIGTHIGARPSYISTLINDLLVKTPKQMNLDDIAKFHAEYEIIHPFYDGNGRTGRMIMLKQCLESEVSPFFVEEFSRKNYYHGIEYYQVTNSTEALVNYFTQQQNRFKTKYLE